MAKNISLSKSQYIKGKQCAKALWFHYHRKDLLPETDDKAEARFESGREVGELARQLFPGGKLVDCKPWEIEKSLQLTKELVQQGASVIYEAAALAKRCCSQATIIHKEARYHPEYDESGQGCCH